MKKLNNRGLGHIILFAILVVVVSVVVVGITVHHHATNKYAHNDSALANTDNKILKLVLMTVKYTGGNCIHAGEGPDACAVTYDLYENGEFREHTKVSQQEITQLKQVIRDTDFLSYGTNKNPSCPSFLDASDEVLIFPQKYPDQEFRLCMLDLSNDQAFAFINKVIDEHMLERNL